MICTSFFKSRAPQHRKVCIAKNCPRGWCGHRAPELAPSDPFSPGDWRARYLADLRRRFPRDEDLRAYLERLEAAAPDPILCCYESDPGQCHRRVLAAHVLERLGRDIPEWSDLGSLFEG